MPINVDFSEIPGLEPFPEGEYLAEIVSAKEGVSGTGNPKIDIRWKVLGGEFEGRQVFDTLAFAESALWRTKLVLQRLGWDKDFAGDLEAEDLLGKVATIVVGTEPEREDAETGETYEARNRIARVKTADVTAEDLLS